MLSTASCYIFIKQLEIDGFIRLRNNSVNAVFTWATLMCACRAFVDISRANKKKSEKKRVNRKRKMKRARKTRDEVCEEQTEQEEEASVRSAKRKKKQHKKNRKRTTRART